MERNYAFDSLKFVAVFCVVCIHTNPFNGTEIFGIPGKYVDVYIIDAISRFAVPFFFMVSGYLFEKKITLAVRREQYAINYIFKLLKMFAYWYTFYMIYGLSITFGKAYIESVNFRDAVLSYMNDNFSLLVFLNGEGGFSSSHLWYLVALIWAIFIIYLNIKFGNIKLLLALSFILNIIGVLGQSYYGAFDFNFPFDTRNAIFFGVFYTTLGYTISINYISVIKKVEKLSNRWFTMMISFLLLLQIFERVLSKILWDGPIGEYFLSTIPLSVILFLYALKNKEFGKKSKIRNFGKNSGGIYVLHPFFISLPMIFFEFIDFDVTRYLIFHLAFTPLVFLLSHFCYNNLQKIKNVLKFKAGIYSAKINLATKR